MRVFISYPRKDKEKTLELVEVLRRGGHEVWIDDQLRVGPEWQTQLRDAIAKADSIVLALTPHWVDSPYCQWEFVTAVELGKQVIPVLLTAGKQLPERISKYQYADFSAGFSNKAQVERFLDDLMKLAVTVDKSVLREFDKPGLEVVIPQVIQAENYIYNQGTINQTQIESQTNVYGEKKRDWSVPTIVGLILILIIAAAVVLSALPEGSRNQVLHTIGLVGPSPTPTATPSPTPLPTPTLTPTPERLSASGFNVVVAGFGYQNNEGVVESATLADDMSDIVTAELNQITQIDSTVGWRTNGVGRILGQTPVERETQAAAIAEALNADVVIYGLIRTDGIFTIFEPEFYITAQFAAVEPDLIGADSLGTPVEFVGNSEIQILAANTFQQRLGVMRFFLRGLAFYLAGNFTGAQASFESALEVDSEDLEVLYVFAGNAAIRIPDAAQALEFYDEALRQRPEYARALVGRGVALYRRAVDSAGETPPAYDPDLTLDPALACSAVDEPLPTEPQLLGELSLRCYQEAARSTDKPETADIDVKVAFGLGQTNLWLSLIGYGDHWDEVRNQLELVLALYEEAPPERQLRIRVAAAHANAWLGLRTISVETNNPPIVCDALTHYQTAIALLREDVNRTYNQNWIDLYGQQTANLEDFLTERSYVCPTPSP